MTPTPAAWADTLPVAGDGFDPNVCIYAVAMTLRGNCDGSAEGTASAADVVACWDYLRRRLAAWTPGRRVASDDHFRRFLQAVVDEAAEAVESWRRVHVGGAQRAARGGPPAWRDREVAPALTDPQSEAIRAVCDAMRGTGKPPVKSKDRDADAADATTREVAIRYIEATVGGFPWGGHHVLELVALRELRAQLIVGGPLAAIADSTDAFSSSLVRDVGALIRLRAAPVAPTPPPRASTPPPGSTP